jgi:CheY-like chemotaxis protein
MPYFRPWRPVASQSVSALDWFGATDPQNALNWKSKAMAVKGLAKLSKLRCCASGRFSMLAVLGARFIHCSAKYLTISLNTSRAVLVVDDSVAIRSIVVDILRQHGYTVYEAESGDTALTEWQSHKDEIGVVLSDVVMPGGIDGITLARHLRKRSPNLSIVLLSSHINEDTQWVTEEANFSFLPKPFESTQLVETVRSILG